MGCELVLGRGGAGVISSPGDVVQRCSAAEFLQGGAQGCPRMILRLDSDLVSYMCYQGRAIWYMGQVDSSDRLCERVVSESAL